MQITTSANPYLSQARPARGQASSAPTNDGPTDSVTLSSGRSHDYGTIGLMTVTGAVPVVGSVTNFMAMIGAGLNHKENLTYLNLGAAGANLVGTGCLLGGLLGGSSTVTNMGLGLLGASGVAAGVTAYALT